MQGIGIDHRAGEARVKLRVGFGCLKLMEFQLAVGPGHLEGPRGEAGVAILLDEEHGGLAGFGDAGDEVPVGGSLGMHHDALPDRHDGIEDGSVGIRKRTNLIKSGGVLARAGATDEFSAASLVGNLAGGRTLGRHEMEHPGRTLPGSAGATGAEDGLRSGQNLGLDEEIAESGVCEIGVRRCEDDFGIARQFDAALVRREICQGDAADFDIVFGRNGDLGVGVDLFVTASIFGPALDENGLVMVRLAARWLIGGGPENARLRIAQVAEGAPVVACGVLAPAGHGEILPTAVASSGIGCHDVVAPVREQVNFGQGGVRRGKDTHRAGLFLGRLAGGADLGGMRLQGGRDSRNTFAEK